jgi:beta-glucosidase
VLLCATSACESEDTEKPVPPSELERRVEAWLSQMTLEEKVAQMHGIQSDDAFQVFRTSDNARLGIPSFTMVDGPRGVRAGTATTFPAGMLRGATWDPDLERRVGEAMGAETAAKGATVLLAPTMNLLRHPRWGRTQETYGEDPRHMGAMAAAFIEGAQRYVATTAKHYALNSIEDTRFEVSVQIAERPLREMYLPHFRKVVQEAKVAGVMTAYNRVNGQYSAENFHLVRQILKDEWGFDGFVVSDWILGTRSTVPSALAGLDIEMPTGVFYGEDLVNAVNGGEVTISVIDDAVRRILRKKIEFVVDRPPAPGLEIVESSEHTLLTREVARRGTVLLKNGGVLPLDPNAMASLAVVGELANLANLGDRGSSETKPSYSVSPLAGLQARFGPDKVQHFGAPALSAADRASISAADAAIVVAGLSWEHEGEWFPDRGGDRESLALPPEHEALLAEVVGLNPNTIVILEGSGPLLPGAWLDSAGAVLMAFYPGQEGGHALAELVAGDVSPSGKLPVTFPRSDAQLPAFVNDQPEVEYDLYHGYFFVDREGHEPLYPFGFGLSYTTFSFDALRLGSQSVSRGARLAVEVDVTNRGSRAAEEVVQLYAGADSPSVDRPVRWLVGFGRVSLAPGESATLKLAVSADDLEVWDETSGAFRGDPGAYRLWAGSSSRDLPLEARFSVVR